ncbi:hypothetical protein GOP47_0023050 [Adiantum capillus-veneris]|uniref:F-box domain-containing protein n=1 Tax=Adiantum capillus-veneris TaxID=13818 RepID=A0A9D4U6L7_ADICA|nr:hypothetical protein GOP47_0023050 [Adiantum capillus-veneris]
MREAGGGGAGVALTLVDLTEDVLSCVLSFLRPGEVRACAGVCRRLREVCGQEGKVWAAMCQRRWGSLTSPSRWGHGRIPFTLLYATLTRWEHLIGFWRGVGNGFLALFDWAPDCIVGHKVVPAGLDSYAVRKIPFLWMALSDDGQVTCLLDPAFKTLGASYPRSDSCLKMQDEANSISSTSFTPDLKAMLELGMLLVDVHFVGYHHLVIEEVVQQSGCVSNELAEAATLAAFGSSHNLLELSPPACISGHYSNVPSPYSSSSDTEGYIGSPPGSFQHEMYQFLASKVISAGGERAARKQRRRGKERALSRGRTVLDPEHFVKVTHSSPTKARPLQGLWKGFFDSAGLDFVLVSYDDKEGIVCRKVQDLDGTTKGGSVLWTSESTPRAALPSCQAEEALYSGRRHTRPGCSVAQPREAIELAFDFCKEDFCKEVIGILCTSSCDFHSMFASSFQEGRIWRYANGTFGFGYCHSSAVVDFRALCSEGFLLDAID